jgi:putative FmdB family regulatory protein
MEEGPVPLYEYECQACHHRFERIQQFSDPLVKKCPQCKKGKVRKLPSAPAVRFKGTGWYVTDYGRKSSDTSNPDSGESGKDKDGKEGKGSEKKTGAKEGTAPKSDAAGKGGKKD